MSKNSYEIGFGVGAGVIIAGMVLGLAVAEDAIQVGGDVKVRPNMPHVDTQPNVSGDDTLVNIPPATRAPSPQVSPTDLPSGVVCEEVMVFRDCHNQ